MSIEKVSGKKIIPGEINFQSENILAKSRNIQLNFFSIFLKYFYKLEVSFERWGLYRIEDKFLHFRGQFPYPLKILVLLERSELCRACECVGMCQTRIMFSGRSIAVSSSLSK